METDGPFLRAIAARPADEATRLVFADWLEERGDPRSEYLRLTVEVGRAKRKTRRFALLRERLQELRATLDTPWLLLVETLGASFRPQTFGCEPEYLPFREPIGM